jgi:WXG100 family type VII secretion target
MTRLAVDLEQLERLVEHLERGAAQLHRLRADVDGRVAGLHAEWTGAAAAAHEAAQSRWAAGAAEVHEALAVLRSIASGAHANYSAAVQVNRRMWAL